MPHNYASSALARMCASLSKIIISVGRHLISRSIVAGIFAQDVAGLMTTSNLAVFVACWCASHVGGCKAGYAVWSACTSSLRRPAKASKAVAEQVQRELRCMICRRIQWEGEADPDLCEFCIEPVLPTGRFRILDDDPQIGIRYGERGRNAKRLPTESHLDWPPRCKVNWP